MATKAQIEANRRNAQKSIGPRTDAGKAAARGNAIRHGMCRTWALMTEESQEDVDKLLALLREENEPVGVNEEILVFKMAVNLFNFDRAGFFLSEALEASTMDQKTVPSLELCLRY